MRLAEASLQFVGEKQIGELGASVGRDPTVVPLEAQIVEVDVRTDAMPRTAHRHDARAVHREYVIKE